MSANSSKHLLSRAVAALVTTALVIASTVVVSPGTASAAPVSPEEQAIAEGLAGLSEALKGLDNLDELGQVLPLTELLPTGNDGLDLLDSLQHLVDTAQTPLVDAGDLEILLDGLNNQTVGGVQFFVDADVDGDAVTFEDLRLQRQIVDAPLAFVTDEISLEGGTIGGTLTLDLTGLTGTLDTTLVPELYLAMPNTTGHLTADLAVDFGTGVNVRLGILDVTVTGNAAAAVDFTIDFVDPDGDGRIDLDELATSAALDILNVEYASSSASINASMTVASSSLLAGVPALAGTLTYADSDLSDDVVDTLEFDGPDLENFTNMGPEQILVAVAQLAVSLQAMQTRVANTGLPMLGAAPPVAGVTKSVENLSDLIDINDKLGQFFVDKGLASPESPFELKIGDIDGDGQPDVDLAALDLDSVDEIITALGAYLSDTADLDYADGAITFDLAFGAVYEAPPAVVKINDQLASAGLRGVVSGNGTAGIDIDAEYDVDVTFGIDLTDFSLEDPITDRLFIETGGTEVTGNAFVAADLNLGGTIGFLEVALQDDVAGPGTVPILGKRDGDEAPMISIDLVGGADGKVTLSELYDSLGSLDVARNGNVFTLDGTAFDVTGAINAAVPPTRLNATATIGQTTLGDAWIEFAWSDLLNEAPEIVDMNAQFADDFQSFDFDTDNPLALFNQIVDTVDAGLAALDNLGASGDPQNPGILDQELPLIGTSPRDTVAFLDDVRDKINEIAQNPAGSLQRLEIELEIAIAEALGVDLSALGAAPDPNDAAFINDSGTPADPSDDVFDSDAFQQAIDDFLAELQTFLGDNDYVNLEYVEGNSPGAVVITLNLGVCSSLATYAASGCTREIPLSTSFNFDTSTLGDFAGIVAAQGDGVVSLDYNASVTLGLGVELPDISLGELPKPFVTDDSKVSVSVAGLFTGSFDASIGPFEISVGSDTTPAEDCTNNLDDDGDGFVNDDCAQVGDTPEEGDACANDVDDDPDDDDQSDGADDDTPSAVNDGCPAASTLVQAKAGAAAVLQGSVTGDRAYLLPGAGEPGLVDLFGSIDLATAVTPNPVVDCGAGAMYACGSLPLFISAGGPTDTPLGAIQLQVTSLVPFTATAGPPGIFDTILANLQDAAPQLAWQLIGQGLVEFGTFIDESTSAAAYDVDVPVVGDILDGGAAIADAFNNGLATPLGTFLQSFDPTDLDDLETGLKNQLLSMLGTDPNTSLLKDRDENGVLDAADIVIVKRCANGVVCDTAAGDTLFDLTDVSVEFQIGDVLAAADPIPFDFGIPGLRLATTDGDGDGVADGVTAGVEWTIDVGFGLSLTEGFYLVTAGTNDITVGVTVDTPDLSADIAFLGIEVDGDAAKPDGRPDEELSLTLAIDLPEPITGKLPLTKLATIDPAELLPELNATVDLYWPIKTAPEFGGSSAGDGTLPTVLATLDLTWQASLSVDGFDYSDLNLGFREVQLDLGSFISDFLDPVLGEVQKFTKPLQPIIDTVSAPIPGISQLAELVGADPVTMLSLFEAISGNDLTLIRTLLDVITFVNAISGLGNSADGILIDIGSFTVSGEMLGEAELPANQKSDLIAAETTETASIVDAINQELDESFAQVFENNLAEGEEFSDDEPGFTFPAFEDLSSIFDLIVGQDVTLIRFASGPLKAEFGWSQSFGPIAVGPVPVSIVISGSASIEGRFAVGYDTKGVRQLVQALTADDGPDVSFLQGFGFLFNGLFIDDLNAAGQDVPEIRLVVEFAAGAAVDLVIVSAGVEGGVRATLDLNLHDGGFFEPIPPENLDGKLRLDEIASFIFNNPICLFDVSGKLEAFIRIFVEIDLFLFSARFEFTVVNITLLELENITEEFCQPPEPVLAEKKGDVLILNTGPNAGRRNFAEEEPNEKYTVRAIDHDSVLVTAFGFEETHDGIAKVVGDFGDGKDQVRFDAGSNETADAQGNISSTPVPFTIATEVCGGAGDDKMYGGEATDRFVGDGAWNGVYDTGFACNTGEAGSDGIDELTGNAGGDELWGTGNADILNGGSGDDTINAGSGNDQATGDLGGDTINGGAGDDTLKGGADADPTTYDTDPDTAGVQLPPADFSDDVINGEAGIDTIDGDYGNDTITGGTENDRIVAGFGNDSASGNEGEDVIFGNEGDDPLLSGGPGDDVVFGMLGNDHIEGNEDDDNLLGNEGDDDIEGGSGKDVILGDSGEINRAPDPLGSTLDPTNPDLPLVTPTASTGAAGDTDLDGGDDDDVIYGQAGADTMNGGGGNDLMVGDVGTDTMSGDAGGDTMFGDNDADVMYGDNSSASNACADGVDTMRGGAGDDTMSGNAAGDSIIGDSGNDTIYGDAVVPGDCDGADVIRGQGDPDRIWGNADGDTIGGDGADDRIVGGSIQSGQPDGSDTIHGDAADDVITGDNADITGSGGPDAWLVTLRIDSQGTGDTLFGDGGDDRVYGQRGDDTIDGGTEADAVEGNDGIDTIFGGTGNDDLVGGSSAFDGIIDADRVGTGSIDTGDIINGGPGVDYIAGDNALINRNLPAPGRESLELFDLATTSQAAAVGSFGDDMVLAGGGDDQVFGQGGTDNLAGGEDDDYIEGNDGDDTIRGNDGDDDLVGGGSANDGKIDEDRIGETLSDVGETLIEGGAGEDFIAGDNALMDRNIPIGAIAPIVLFDVETVASGTKPGTGGGELLITGDSGPDWIFGQTGNDTISGGAGNDYVEGNNGVDVITGDGGDDDLVGGGSANDGVIDANRVGDGLLDQGENPIDGGADDDWITGDNALVNRNRPAAGRAPVELFDVARAGGPAISVLTSGGDVLLGSGGDDMVFGQGNGAQPATQTDPDDDRNNDFVGTLPANGDFDRAGGTTDEDAGAWTGDSIYGGVGDDYIEGNHGNDLIFGNGTAETGQDEDDIAGGGSANDGKIFPTARLGLGAALLDGFDTIHGDSGDNTLGDDDAVVGDNGWIQRLATKQVGTGPDGLPVDQFDRNTQMTSAKAVAGTFANDFVSGNGGHDELFGQQGDDYVEGGYGSDAIVGDLGKVTTDLFTDTNGNTACGAARVIQPNEPFVEDPVCQPGTLFRLVQLYAYDDTVTNGANAVAAGNDVLLGLDGDDWIHGGAGVDLINGDGDGGAEVVDPEHTYTTIIVDPNPASADTDRIFGGDSNGAGTVSTVTGGNGDAIWGGRGHDHTYGGRGDDMLEVRPNPGAPINFPVQWAAWAEADVESYHGIDFIYGGYDQDAMQANVADNGPVNGDRLFDWVGVYNIYYLCPATYGAYVSIRDQSPAILTYFQDQARTDGALNPQTSGTSGYNELALVYKPDVKNNNHPPYPGTPGHFFCGT